MIELIAHEMESFISSDFHLAPNIPEGKLRNARQSYCIPRDETVFALIDSTVLGSAKHGMAFCHAGVYWKNDWTTCTARAYLSWMDIAALAAPMAARGDQLHLTNDCIFNLAGSQVKAESLRDLFESIRQRVGGHATAPIIPTHAPLSGYGVGMVEEDADQTAPPLPRASPATLPTAAADPEVAGSYDPVRLQIMQTVAGRYRLGRQVHLAPAVKVRHVDAIRAVCGNQVAPFSIFVVVDNTFFNSCQDFLIVTDKEIIAKSVLAKVERIALEDIRSIHHDRSEFFINKYPFQCFDQLSTSEVAILCDFLIELGLKLTQVNQQEHAGFDALMSVVEEAYALVTDRLTQQMGDLRTGAGGEQARGAVGHLVKTLFGIIPLIIDQWSELVEEPQSLHYLLLSYAMVAGGAFHCTRRRAVQDGAELYRAVNIAILNIMVAQGQEHALFVHPEADFYSREFVRTLDLGGEGHQISALLQPLLAGDRQERKVADAIQCALVPAASVLDGIF